MSLNGLALRLALSGELRESKESRRFERRGEPGFRGVLTIWEDGAWMGLSSGSDAVPMDVSADRLQK